MPKAYPFPEGSKEQLRAALARARTIPQYRRVLCLWLRAALGLSAEQVATAIGWSPTSVRHFQARYMKQGDAAIDGPGRGGPRRGVLRERDECELFHRLRQQAWPGWTLAFHVIHAAVEQVAGHPVPSSTISKMLARHGWRRHQPVSVVRRASPDGVERPRRSGIWTPPESPARDTTAAGGDAPARIADPPASGPLTPST
jgi:transposase